MDKDPYEYPRLRPLEPAFVAHEGRRMISLRDPSGLSEFAITVSPNVFAVTTLFTGDRSLAHVQAEYVRQFGQLIRIDDIKAIIQKLDTVLFLETPHFQAHRQKQVEAYRNVPARPTRPAGTFGCGGLPLDKYLEEIMAEGQPADLPPPAGRLMHGIIAPHLDYARGRPCYAQAYRTLKQHCKAGRFVILGTDHFGQSTGPVATAKDFDTPFGIVPTDRDFLSRLSQKCGVDLCENEFCHLREHSVELQVVWLKHIFADRPLSIVPVLCPDPCGRGGTASPDGRIADLRALARAIRSTIEQDATPTGLIAGADLSHVGVQFGDERLLDDVFLAEVEKQDRFVLDQLAARGPDGFAAAVAKKQNPTRICSVGCIFTLAAALPGARVHVLAYHQALDRQSQTCVTCTAAAFVASERG